MNQRPSDSPALPPTGTVAPLRWVTRLIVLVLALSACTPSGGSPSVSPTPSNAATSAAASGPCIDRGQLADSADSVTVMLQGVTAALKIPNTEQARSLAGTAAAGMRSIADLVRPVQPEAEKDLRDAADALDKAKSDFPSGMSLVGQVQTEFEQGLQVARTAVCAD